MLTTMRTDLRQMNGIPEVIGAMYVCRTVWGFPQIDSTAVDCGAVELDDRTFRRTSFPPDEFSAGRDRNYMEDYSIVWGFPQIDSAAVDCDTGAVELDDLIFRRTSCPPGEMETIYGWPVSAHSISDWVTPFRISPKTWTKRSLVGSSLSRWIGSADVPLCHHFLPAVSRSTSHEVEMYLFFPLCHHPVWPDGGSVSSELDMYLLVMYLYALLCRHLLSFDPAVR